MITAGVGSTESTPDLLIDQKGSDVQKRILIKGGTVITMDAENSVRRADVLVEGDRIIDVQASLESADADVIDASDAIVMPGLIDTHMHMWQYPWRGLVARKWGSEPYMRVFWPARETFEPEDTFDGILGSAYEMIEHGITGTVDFFHGANGTPAHADAALAAHHLTGQRVMLAYGMTTAYVGVSDAQFEEDRIDRVADFDRLRGEAQKSGNPLVDVGLALITPSERLMDAFAEEIEHARSVGAHMTFHQNVHGEILAMHDRGLLGPDILPVHSNTISDQELAWMAEAGMPVSVTPQTEITSARSMSILRRALRAGVRLSIGVDTPAILPLDMIGQLKLAYFLTQAQDAQIMHEGVRSPLNPRLDTQTATFDDYLRVGTVNGAYGMGIRSDLGMIRTGALADLVVIRPRDPHVALEDPVAHVMLTAPAPSDVDAVIIGGIVRKRDGALTGVDAAEHAQRNRDVRERILARIRG